MTVGIRVCKACSPHANQIYLGYDENVYSTSSLNTTSDPEACVFPSQTAKALTIASEFRPGDLIIFLKQFPKVYWVDITVDKIQSKRFYRTMINDMITLNRVVSTALSKQQDSGHQAQGQQLTLQLDTPSSTSSQLPSSFDSTQQNPSQAQPAPQQDEALSSSQYPLSIFDSAFLYLIETPEDIN
ncbi:hypothetical protein BDA99DRAFT_559309 [Phascolomyces articulosus]|uniref:Uncharacterized protein n=1 Tax=Phascolomyces articulosus TaxID=60185 RepID=A0AAD5K267_9FUNG|nr:hypothetical protein BDA99DRAFT_559309 [Phascolomyces articulosus]